MEGLFVYGGTLNLFWQSIFWSWANFHCCCVLVNLKAIWSHSADCKRLQAKPASPYQRRYPSKLCFSIKRSSIERFPDSNLVRRNVLENIKGKHRMVGILTLYLEWLSIAFEEYDQALSVLLSIPMCFVEPFKGYRILSHPWFHPQHKQSERN